MRRCRGEGRGKADLCESLEALGSFRVGEITVDPGAPPLRLAHFAPPLRHHHANVPDSGGDTIDLTKVLPSFVTSQPLSARIMGVKRSRRDSLSSSEDSSSPFSREQSVDIKLVHIDAEVEQPTVMKCLLPPHDPMGFASYEEYDVHYQKMHTNRCSECQKNFPDEHILHLHIAENHDPFIAARRERGEQTVGL